MEFKKDFFEGLGETLSRTAKDLSDRASNVYETQKIRSKIASEERAIEKLKSDIGTLIYARYEEGEQFEGELGRLLIEIKEHRAAIHTLEDDNASLKGKKICPSCRKEVPADAQFCPACGTPCPGGAPEDDIMDAEEISVLEEPEAEPAQEDVAGYAEDPAPAAQAESVDEMEEVMDAAFEPAPEDTDLNE